MRSSTRAADDEAGDEEALPELEGVLALGGRAPVGPEVGELAAGQDHRGEQREREERAARDRRRAPGGADATEYAARRGPGGR